jgi:hypothetical protein
MPARYSAIVLDEASHKKLVDWAIEKFPTIKREKYEVIAHHMTITMGELPSYLQSDKGTVQSIEVSGYGNTDKVFAVRVSGYYTKNKVPHITLAVNRAKGGKPVQSNEIKNWQPLDKPFNLKGVVTEVE